ncbi:hypothetical protein R1sor_008025 [Riccia sorocarpa]|uniref:Uncharacterized protein n=1 Tax=Riccia sorocarpa TaxID=122646 RepID=A0ABD3HUG5_9MARC
MSGTSDEPGSDDVSDDPAQIRFQEIDSVEWDRVEQGGRRRSQSVEDWWIVKKIDCTKSIEDLSEETDLKEFVDHMAMLFIQVKKKDGNLYPPTTVQCLLRAVGRVIRSRQEQRSVESGAPVHPFNILKDARYHKVKLAADEAVQRAMDRGLGKTIQKSDILTLDEERRMLAQEKCSLQCPRGLNYVMSYYCLRNFFIRGAAELRHVNWEDFSIENLVIGQVLRYTPGTSKNWKIDVARCGADNLRKPVDCGLRYGFGVYSFVYLYAVLHYDFGVNTLSSYMKDMVEDLPDIRDKVITNKSGRGVGISRMVQSGVPTTFGMLQTGHRDPKSFVKYDQTSAEVKNRAIQRIISGEVRDGKRLTFDEAFDEEMSRLACIQEQDILAMAAIKENSHPNKPEQQISCREAVIEVQETVVMQAAKGVQDVALLQTTTTTVAEAAVAGEMKRGRPSEKLEEFANVALLQTTTTTVAEAAVAGEMKRGRPSEKLEEFGRFERYQEFQEYKRFKKFQEYKEFNEFQNFR